MTTDEILTRFRTIIPINESGGEYKLKEYKNIIDEFVKDCKELQVILKFFKKQIKTIVPLKEQELSFYKHFVDFAGKYEDINARNIRLHGDQAVELNLALLTGEGKKLDLNEKLTKMVKIIDYA